MLKIKMDQNVGNVRLIKSEYYVYDVLLLGTIGVLYLVSLKCKTNVFLTLINPLIQNIRDVKMLEFGDFEHNKKMFVQLFTVGPDVLMKKLLYLPIVSMFLPAKYLHEKNVLVNNYYFKNVSLNDLVQVETSLKQQLQ